MCYNTNLTKDIEVWKRTFTEFVICRMCMLFFFYFYRGLIRNIGRWHHWRSSRHSSLSGSKNFIDFAKEKSLNVKQLDQLSQLLHDHNIELVLDDENPEDEDIILDEDIDENLIEDSDDDKDWEKQEKDWTKVENNDYAVTQGNVSDPVRLYLRECGATPLLSAEEEMTLAKQIEKGKMLDATEEDKLRAEDAKKKRQMRICVL